MCLVHALYMPCIEAEYEHLSQSSGGRRVSQEGGVPGGSPSVTSFAMDDDDDDVDLSESWLGRKYRNECLVYIYIYIYIYVFVYMCLCIGVRFYVFM